MEKLAKPTLPIVLVIAALSLSIPMTTPAYAQSIAPSTPQFTIQTPNNSTIQLVIENQVFTNSSSVNSIIYYYRVRDHNSSGWIVNGNYILQSNSETTIISIPPIPGMPTSILTMPLLSNATILDFEVQAVAGVYSVTWKPGYIPGAPTQCQSGDGYEEITFNPAQSSDWSPAKTVAIPANYNSPNANLTPTQTPVITSKPSPNSTNNPTNISTQNANAAIPELPAVIAILPLLLCVLAAAVMLRHQRVTAVASA